MNRAMTRKTVSVLTLGSSLLWATLVPGAAAAVSAPSVVPGSVTLSASGIQSTAGGRVTFTATASDPGGSPEYQFWVEEPNGAWVDAQDYSPNGTFTLSTPSAGNYLVAVDVLNAGQVAAGDWSAAATTLPHGVFVDSAVTVQASVAGGPAGTPITLTASATNIYSPLYQFWWEQGGVWHQSGMYSGASHYTFTPTSSGTVRYVTYAKSPAAANNPDGALVSPVGFVSEYGLASRVALAFANPTVVADGSAVDPLLVTVEDSNGTQVANFSGTVTVSSPAALFAGHHSAVVTVSHGSATVLATASRTGVDTVTADHLVTASSNGSGGISAQGQATNVGYGQATVTATAATPAGLLLTAAFPDLSAASATSDTVTVSLLDLAQDPVASSYPVMVTVTLSGPGSFTATGTTTQELVSVTSSSPLTVWSQQGQAGTIHLTATAGAMSSTTLALPTYHATTPDLLAISSSQGANNSGVYTLYTVSLENSQGNVITAGAAASGTVTVTDNQPSVANWSDSNSVLYYYGSNLRTQEQSFTVPDNGDFTATVANPMTFSLPLVHGQVQFLAQGFASGPPVAITVTGDGLAASTTYQYQTGTPGYAVVETAGNPLVNLSNFESASVAPGQTVTVSAQLTDQNHQPVRMAGQPIWFVLDANPNVSSPLAMLPNGASRSGDTYEAFTNAAGVASATITVPESAPTTDTYPGLGYGYLDTFGIGVAGVDQWSGGSAHPSGGIGYSPTFYVVPSAAVTTALQQIPNPNWPATGRFVAGSTSYDPTFDSSYLWFSPRNALRAPAYQSSEYYWNEYSGYGAEQWLVTSTNPSIVAPTGSDLVQEGPNQWLVYNTQLTYDGALYMPPLSFGSAGAAALTIQDISAPTDPTYSVPITVVPGPSVNKFELWYHGAPVSPSNPVFLEPNAPVELSWVNLDAGGDAVPVASAAAGSATIAAPAGFEFKASGSVYSSSLAVVIPTGESSTSVWVVSGTSATLSSDLQASG